jgi:hypothetical protein
MKILGSNLGDKNIIDRIFLRSFGNDLSILDIGISDID